MENPTPEQSFWLAIVVVAVVALFCAANIYRSIKPEKVFSPTTIRICVLFGLAIVAVVLWIVLGSLVSILLFGFLVLAVGVLPRLQAAASMRLPDGSIPWFIRKADRRKTKCGGSTQVALSFSVFSLVWFALHVSSRLVMGLSWLSYPPSHSFKADSPSSEFMEVWFGISFMALFLELVLAPYVTIRTFLRDHDPMAIVASIPWVLVACYTLWI
ncbi:MAG: hypothetical protein ACYTG0_30210, partial [Planctomycetota bacterium]